MCTWTSVGTRTEKRGRKIGHLLKIYNFRLYFAVFEQDYILDDRTRVV